MADHSLKRWIGAGTMPSKLGYLQATLPLAVLEITGTRVTLRLRPKFLAKLTGTHGLSVGAGDDVVILSVRSDAVWKGVEIRAAGVLSYYFWTKAREEVFSSLAAAGFTVSDATGQLPGEG